MPSDEAQGRANGPASKNTYVADPTLAPRGGMDALCVRCRRWPAIAWRRLPTSVGTWGIPEAVCESCADEVDGLRERCARGAAQVDRAFKRFRRAA
jgi:hypothetical protein